MREWSPMIGHLRYLYFKTYGAAQSNEVIQEHKIFVNVNT